MVIDICNITGADLFLANAVSVSRFEYNCKPFLYAYTEIIHWNILFISKF